MGFRNHQRLKNLLRSTVSYAAQEFGQEPISVQQHGPQVTTKCGKRGTPHRRIIRYERRGAFDRQTGIKVLGGHVMPIIQRYYNHCFLHATKGWRVYSGGPGMTMPSAHSQPVYINRYPRVQPRMSAGYPYSNERQNTRVKRSREQALAAAA